MSTFTRFAIVGGGNVGGVVAHELLKKNLSVTVLTRDPNKASLQQLKESGATLAKVNYEDRESLRKALIGVEAVVSAVSPAVMMSQVEVVHAAKEAGVELFAPSEYGVRLTDGPNHPKRVVQGLLKKLDLPYTIFYAGIFYEFTPIAFGHNYAEGKMNIVGDGNTSFSLTAAREVGELVAHVISTASKEDLRWAKIPFEGDRKSPLEIAGLAEKKLGKAMDLETISYESNKNNFLTDFGSYLSTLAADGLAVTGTKEEVAAAKAKFYPDWKPTPYEAFIS
ncbi:hypothetical protein PHMEG_00021347 [Phytophthora megakarya]|uniref:NmrA-like domain-containing protein n=1 Tax=Phytophthora megakarya TaxID=4795 RepID=A0A225VM28_9STRA|nr:hypothetical protein PHMEG_00021347 [Phytophthora megakarya]